MLLYKRCLILLLVGLIIFAPLSSRAEAIVSKDDLTLNADSELREQVVIVRVIESPKIDTLLSFAAVFLSLVAIVCTAIISYRTIKLQKQSNIERVRPIVSFKSSNNPIQIRIANDGIGPAVLKSITWYDGNGKSYDNIKKLCRINGITKEYRLSYNISVFDDNTEKYRALLPSEDLIFIESKAGILPEQKQYLYWVLQNVTVKLSYTDLYESEEWIIDWDFSWYSSYIK